MGSVPARALPAATLEPGDDLDVRGLTVRLPDDQVLIQDLDLHLTAGDSLFVTGRSGSGKTTLARCVAGLHRDHDGEILLDGTPLPRSLRDRDRAQLAAVQYVFQDAHAAFDEYRPVVQQVARTAVRLRGADPDTATRRAHAYSLLKAVLGTAVEDEHLAANPCRIRGAGQVVIELDPIALTQVGTGVAAECDQVH